MKRLKRWFDELDELDRLEREKDEAESRMGDASKEYEKALKAYYDFYSKLHPPDPNSPLAGLNRALKKIYENKSWADSDTTRHLERLEKGQDE